MNAFCKRRVFPVLIVSALFLAGCGFLAGGSSNGMPEPTPTVEAPSGIIAGRVWLDECRDGEGCVIADGQTRPDGVESPAEPGLEGVLVQLGEGACPSFGLAESFTGANGTYLFPSLSARTYCVSVDPNVGPNAQILGSTPWTHPGYGLGIRQISVSLQAPNETRLVSFGRAAEIPPPATATPTPSIATPVATATGTVQGCVNRVAFEDDVTIPDNTRFETGKLFDKTWRLRNAGTCTWTTGYDLVFVSGHRMSGPEDQALTRSVAPGQTVDLTARLRSPSDNGLYRGQWMLRSEENVLFGLGSSANLPFWVQILVGPLGTTSNGTWRGEYFARRDLTGTVGFVRSDPVIDFHWKTGSPGSPLGSDNFSVRWTGDAIFEAGTYRFKIMVDDGARLYVDNQLLINAWEDGSVRERAADVSLARGSHRIRLEYYERTRDAAVQLTWSKVSKPTYSDWKGEYWPNREFKGDPALVRNDRSVSFDWNDESPAIGIPDDDFSVRWTRKINFSSGTYRLSLRSDDGSRVYIDGKLVLDNWRDNDGGQTRTVDLSLSGTKAVKVEYYERRGEALIEFGWTRLEAPITPTATGTPTATMTPTDTATPSATPSATETIEATATETLTPSP
jgi:hypothetical protein